jgi:hypothetical protein
VKAILPILLLGLVACNTEQPNKQTSKSDSGAALDRLAIEKGLVPDPQSRSFEGRFETQSELGTDKFCAVADGSSYRIGFLSVYGPESKCEGQGTATQNGDNVDIELTGKDGCAFTANYDGIVLRFPGSVHEGCSAFCTANANLSGTRYYFVDAGADAAKRTLGREIERLCR